MVLIFAFFGYTKWHQYAAEEMVPFISHSPFIFWLYPAFGVRRGSEFLGASEWTILALLYAGFWDKRFGVLGSLGSKFTFATTVTITPFMPNGWDPSAGFPAMAGLVPFLMKDFVLLAVSIYLLKQDVVRLLAAYPSAGAALSPATDRAARRAACFYSLRLHEIMHQRRNLIGFRVEREVAGVENVNLGVGHILPVALRLAEIERQVMLAPDHQQTRLLLAHPGLPLGVGVDVRSIVVEEVGLNIRLSGLTRNASSSVQRSGSYGSGFGSSPAWRARVVASERKSARNALSWAARSAQKARRGFQSSPKPSLCETAS